VPQWQAQSQSQAKANGSAEREDDPMSNLEQGDPISILFKGLAGAPDAAMAPVTRLGATHIAASPAFSDSKENRNVFIV